MIAILVLIAGTQMQALDPRIMALPFCVGQLAVTFDLHRYTAPLCLLGRSACAVRSRRRRSPPTCEAPQVPRAG